eukprot:448484-Rhodomonas_salina.1
MVRSTATVRFPIGLRARYALSGTGIGHGYQVAVRCLVLAAMCGTETGYAQAGPLKALMQQDKFRIEYLVFHLTETPLSTSPACADGTNTAFALPKIRASRERADTLARGEAGGDGGCAEASPGPV